MLRQTLSQPSLFSPPVLPWFQPSVPDRMGNPCHHAFGTKPYRNCPTRQAGGLQTRRGRQRTDSLQQLALGLMAHRTCLTLMHSAAMIFSRNVPLTSWSGAAREAMLIDDLSTVPASCSLGSAAPHKEAPPAVLLVVASWRCGRENFRLED